MSAENGRTLETSPPQAPLRGCFAADCANAALKEETKKLYAAIFKGQAAKEGPGPLLPLASFFLTL